jgi:acyl-coenzyme A synthetase/AMP-(fatty) acid ligase
MKVTLFTSGSTADPKKILHENIERYVKNSIDEIGLTSKDIVLDVFPANVIAHYTVTAQPALTAGAHLISLNFDPYNYIKIFNEYRPTYISLIPRHYDILSKTKGWDSLDMSCVRYMVTGSSSISQNMIDEFRSKGVQTVANWYGMTEMPPPVFVGINSETFDFVPRKGYTVEFDDAGECIINGWYTGDLFNLAERKFIRRRTAAENATWKR